MGLACCCVDAVLEVVNEADAELDVLALVDAAGGSRHRNNVKGTPLAFAHARRTQDQKIRRLQADIAGNSPEAKQLLHRHAVEHLVRESDRMVGLGIAVRSRRSKGKGTYKKWCGEAVARACFGFARRRKPSRTWQWENRR